MTHHPDYEPHKRYTVTLIYRGGRKKDVSVLTNRGELKAVHLATLGQAGIFGSKNALGVRIRLDGDPELDANGVAVMEGYSIDRNEW